MLKDNWVVYLDIDTLSKKLVNDILVIANKAIELNDNFKIVLAGGTSLVHTYKMLSKADSDWSKWFIYIGDERCLPPKDKDRNDNLINQVWLDKSQIPEENINFIRAELGLCDGANHYESVLKDIKYFDVVLLSMGEDGHTASLFPGHSYRGHNVVIERNSPKYPKERISMSYLRLGQSRHVYKIISGSEKNNAIKLWLSGANLPISKVNSYSEKVYIVKDVLTEK